MKAKQNQDIECYLCHKSGHYRKDCPLLIVEAERYLTKTKRVKSETDGLVQATVTKQDKRRSSCDDDATFITFEVALASGRLFLYRYDILCDNQATINKDMLINIRNTDDMISVGGVGGTLGIKMMEDLPGFGPVYYHPECIANILCFHDLANKGLIKFDDRNNYFVVNIFGSEYKYFSQE